MRAHILPLTGLVLVAGLSLTACDDGGGSKASDAASSSSAQGSGGSSQDSGDTPAPAGKVSAPRESASAPDRTESAPAAAPRETAAPAPREPAVSARKESASGSGSGSAPQTSAVASGPCKTSQLGFSAVGGKAEGTYLISFKNTGSAACTLQGFAGVDLKSKWGSVSVDRSKVTPPKVDVKPGEKTRFLLHFPPNTSGGSGLSFTSMKITPPDETHSRSVSVYINVAASDGPVPLTIDPVGTAG